MNKNKIGKKSSLFNWIIYIFFGILAIITFFPFYNVIILSLANRVGFASHTPYILPYVIDFSGYKAILQDQFFLKSLLVTLTITLLGTALNMIFSVTIAYVLSRKKLVGKNIFLLFILFTMLFSGGLVPTYLLVTKLGLLNSIWSMILPTLMNTYYVIIMKNYFQSMPVSLEESAFLEGANDFQIMTKIYLPLSKPFLATFTLFYAVERWNEWWHAYLYISDKSLEPLQIYLRNILVQFDPQVAHQLQDLASEKMTVFSTSVQMATIVVTMVPILCFYPFLQKYFVKGLMLGSVKE